MLPSSTLRRKPGPTDRPADERAAEQPAGPTRVEGQRVAASQNTPSSERGSESPRSRESHFNKAVPPRALREAYLLTLPHGEDEDGVGGADRGSLAHVVPQGAI